MPPPITSTLTRAVSKTPASKRSVISTARRACANALLTEDHRFDIAQPFVENVRQEQTGFLNDMRKDLERVMEKAKKEREEFKVFREKLVQELNLKDVTIAKARDEIEKFKMPAHPTYGQLLSETGNRRVFAADPRRLCNRELFPIYESQRSFRPDRADAIAESVRKDDRFQGFPGTICMFELTGEAAAATRGRQVRGIVDGQHRIGAIERLLQSKHWPLDRNVLVEVYYVSDPTDGARLFRQINRAQPVLDIDLVQIDAEIMESEQQPTEAQQKEMSRLKEELKAKAVIDKVVEDMRMGRFKEMFKPSQKCRPPHVNADLFRESLFVTPATRKAAKHSEAKLMDLILKLNEDMMKENFPETQALNKAKEFGFFLGMSKKWQDA